LLLSSLSLADSDSCVKKQVKLEAVYTERKDNNGTTGSTEDRKDKRLIVIKRKKKWKVNMKRGERVE
jgi:hypothetical protein